MNIVYISLIGRLARVNMLWFLLFLLSVFVYFSIKLWRVQTHWKRKGIAYDVPVPFFGMMLDVIIGRKSFFECMDEIYRAHPDARYMPEFNNKYLL